MATTEVKAGTTAGAAVVFASFALISTGAAGMVASCAFFGARLGVVGFGSVNPVEAFAAFLLAAAFGAFARLFVFFVNSPSVMSFAMIDFVEKRTKGQSWEGRRSGAGDRLGRMPLTDRVYYRQ
ncbi:MAG: hypothetical protein WC360_06355 [Opitutales bacterium]